MINLAVTDEVAEMIDAVARHGGGFYERQRLFTERLEGGFQLHRRELPVPGGSWVTELVETGGAFAPRDEQIAGWSTAASQQRSRRVLQMQRPRHTEVRVVSLDAPLGRGLGP